jgi:hypothetical protein
MNISGSAAWFAKADLGVTVHRTDESVEIHCWKSRFKWVGSQGVAHLNYNMSNGTYTEHVAAPEPSPKALSKLRGREWDDFDEF